MIIALITILLLGGSGGMLATIENADKQIKIVMLKGEDRQLALNVLKDAKQATKRFNKVRNKANKKLLKALQSHDLAVDEVDDLWSDFHQQNYEFGLEIVEFRFRLKEHINKDEWREVFPL